MYQFNAFTLGLKLQWSSLRRDFVFRSQFTKFYPLQIGLTVILMCYNMLFSHRFIFINLPVWLHVFICYYTYRYKTGKIIQYCDQHFSLSRV